MRKIKRFAALTAVALLAAGCPSECGGRKEARECILLAGSTSMEAYAAALAERYMELHGNVSVTVEFTGSEAGIAAVLGGSADIGNSSRVLKDDEKAAGAAENIVALDVIAVCVDPANPVEELTTKELAAVYRGDIVNWSEVGGRDMPIVVVGREAGSGTRSVFESLLGLSDSCDYANELDSNGAVTAKVLSTPGAVGYVSLGSTEAPVRLLRLDGAAPDAENVRNGSYVFTRPFVMATAGEISEQSRLLRSWFDFVLGEEGRSIAASAGLVPVSPLHGRRGDGDAG